MSGYKKYKNNTRGWDTPVYHEIYVLFFTTGYSVYLDVQSFIMKLRMNFVINQVCHEQYWSQKHKLQNTIDTRLWLVTDNLFYLLHICHGCHWHKTLSTVSQLMSSLFLLSQTNTKHCTMWHYVAF